MDYQHIITIEPDKRSGKPCIRGMRITVYDVLDYLASDMSIEEILRDFPDLTHEDIRSCLALLRIESAGLCLFLKHEIPLRPKSLLPIGRRLIETIPNATPRERPCVSATFRY